MKHYFLNLLSIVWVIIGSVNNSFAIANNKVLLYGKIMNEKHQSIPQALVAVLGTSKGAYSNNVGKYELALQAGKEYTITISSLGYKTLKTKVLIGSNTEKDYVLEQDIITLDGVTVHGKSKNVRIKESSFSVNALDVQSQANTLTNLNTIVGKSSGVKVRESGGVGSNFDLSINGLSGKSVRYFIDGIPMSTMGTGVNLSNLPVNIVDRVEIYKGVVPTYLGADALGGAINVVTKNNTQNYLDASYGIGSFGTHKTNVNAQYVFKKSGVILRPMFSHITAKNNYKMKDVEVWDEDASTFLLVDRKRFHDNYTSLIGQMEVGVQNKKWCEYFFVSGSYSQTDKELQTGSTQKVVYGNAKKKTKGYRMSARYKKRDFIVPDLHTSMSFSYTNSLYKVVDTVFRKYDWNGNYITTSRSEILGRAKSVRHIDRPLLIGRANFDYKINSRHSLNLNYLFSHLTNKRSDDVDADFESSEDVLSKSIWGLSYQQKFFKNRLVNTFFVKDYFSFLNVKQSDLSWITGSKENYGSTTTNNIGYGAGFRYKFSDALFLKASFEHSLRLPRSRELLGNGTTVYPNFNLKPEVGDNFNLGILGTLAVNNKHAFNYEINAFLRKTKDYIMFQLSEADGLGQYDNVASVTIKGVETELSYAYDDWFKIRGNISYLDERSKTRYQPNGKPEITYNNRMPNRPWLFGNMGIELKKKNLFSESSVLKFEYNFHYVHWFYLTWEGYGNLNSKSIIPTQNTSDVSLSYAFRQGRYNLSAECLNIFDHTVYDNYMLQKPGRSFFLKFRVFIN